MGTASQPISLEVYKRLQFRKEIFKTGCTVGLLAWLNERVPTLDKARCLPKVPRFFRWLNSLGLIFRVHAVTELSSLKRSYIQDFYRIGTEEKFVRAICHASEEAAQQIAVLKVELRKKDATIAKLLVNCKELDLVLSRRTVKLSARMRVMATRRVTQSMGMRQQTGWMWRQRRNILQEDEENQTKEDSEEEKHGEEEKK
ncbi:uncharacterized protein LOC127252351 isoform X1 [Andrographis paniculata]|uniref:uncharacterized protein LOC127252351 isoform X1 n=1 Tax=Andrographis paniculata TaxID=175694 RepID=UPI0021E946B7|nr:uncharacterized protein LOC127252351 isoform X1 [Andrographis paniculata]XP_051132459.1 uncharacterized protein LOC127252351 isoform X1 [Andrographis paniculata]